MSIANVDKIIRVPGRLCYGATDLTAVFPHGGTGLGVIKSIILNPNKTYHKVRAEEFGSEVVDIIDGGESWVLGGILRSFDKDALKKIFPAAAAGAQTQETYIQHPSSSVRSGSLMSASGIKLLFSPDNTNLNPFIIFYNAIPLVDDTAEMNMCISQDWSIGVLFAAVRDSNSKVMAKGFRGDISL